MICDAIFPLKWASTTKTLSLPTINPALSAKGVFERRAYTPSSSFTVSSWTPSGFKGGGINHSGLSFADKLVKLRPKVISSIFK